MRKVNAPSAVGRTDGSLRGRVSTVVSGTVGRLGILAIVLLFPLASHAIVAHLSLPELARRSDLVALLRVVEVPAANPQDLTIEITVRLEDTFGTNDPDCRSEVLRIRETVGLSTAVEYIEGQRLLVFLRRVEDCVFVSESGQQGVLLVTDDHARLLDGNVMPLSVVIDQIKSVKR